MPVIGWLALISLFSTDVFHAASGGVVQQLVRLLLLLLLPEPSPQTIALVNLGVRKLAHVLEYAAAKEPFGPARHRMPRWARHPDRERPPEARGSAPHDPLRDEHIAGSEFNESSGEIVGTLCPECESHSNIVYEQLTLASHRGAASPADQRCCGTPEIPGLPRSRGFSRSRFA